MQRWAAYLLAFVVFAVGFGALSVVANNLYWGASQRPGGDYYCFGRPMPPPLGALLWGTIKPLLIVMPAAACWALYRCVREKAAENAAAAAGRCLGCGYDLTGNESGVCPECGSPRGAD